MKKQMKIEKTFNANGDMLTYKQGDFWQENVYDEFNRLIKKETSEGYKESRSYNADGSINIADWKINYGFGIAKYEE